MTTKAESKSALSREKELDLKDMQSLVKAFQEKEDQLAQLNGELDKIKAKVSDPRDF